MGNSGGGRSKRELERHRPRWPRAARIGGISQDRLKGSKSLVAGNHLLEAEMTGDGGSSTVCLIPGGPCFAAMARTVYAFLCSAFVRSFASVYSHGCPGNHISSHRVKSGGPLSGCETPNEHHSIQMLSPKYGCFGAGRRATFQCFLGNLTMSLNTEVITQIQKTPVMPCVHSCPTGTPYSRILVLMFARPMMTCILNPFLIHWLSRQMPSYKTLKH